MIVIASINFIPIGHERFKAYKLKINAINKLNLAKDVRDKAVEDGQNMATALLYAEVKLGDLLKAIPEKEATSAKGSRLSDMYISHKQSHYAQTLSEHNAKSGLTRTPNPKQLEH